MISNQELLSRINGHSAVGGASLDGVSDITNDRADALDHYLGRPYGDEQEGRSEYVSRDLMEVVDWAMPELMDVILGSGNIAEFIPDHDQDEELCDQQTDYCNYVIMRENDGWFVLHDCIKDSLIMKNGYGEVYFDDYYDVTFAEYENLTSDKLVMLMMELGEDAEVVSQSKRTETSVNEFGEEIEVDIFNIKVRLKKRKQKIVVEPIPVEEIKVSSKHKKSSLKDVDYVERETTKTASDLIAAGLKKSFVDGLPNANMKDNLDNSRNTSSDETLSETNDLSMREISYRKVYIRTDADEDGIAELRCVTLVGNKIPENKDTKDGDASPWNCEVDQVGFFNFSPKRMPHRHVGESLDDDVQDLQEILTVLYRNFLDNTYGLVNQEWLVNERVNLDDFLVSKPLGVKRVEGEQPVDGSARAVEKPNVLNHILPAINSVQEIRAKRTGIRPEVSGLDPDDLQNVKKGVYMQNRRDANSKLQFIARMLVETGVRDMVKIVNGLVMKHIKEEKMVRLRGQYVPVNPLMWKERENMEVNVGLGTGRTDEKRENHMLLKEAMKEAAQVGLVDKQHVYNAFYDFAEDLGCVNPNKYIYNPNSQEFQQMMAQRAQNQQQQPNPLAEVEMIKQQSLQEITRMKESHKREIESAKLQAQQGEKLAKLNADLMLARENNESKEAIAILENEVKALIEGFKLDIGQPGIGAELG